MADRRSRTARTGHGQPDPGGDSIPRMTHRIGLACVALAVLAAPLASSPVQADGGIFDNCTAFNEKFPHGVGRKNAVDQTSGTPVTTFVHSNKKYAAAMKKNDDLDRDGDRIACEKA
jgi:hypothetical protein